MYSKASCPKCGNNSFELTPAYVPKNSNVAVHFVACSKCDSAVGLVPAENPARAIEKSAEEIKSRISGLSSAFGSWANNIGPVIAAIAKKVGAI
jgi:hypothetical protein